MSTRIHMVPVPEDRLEEVYAVLGRPKTESNGVAADPPAEAAEPKPIDVALILRAYRESPPAMVKFIDYLAERPDETVSSRKLAKDIGITWNQLAGMLGAFGRRWHNRYGQPKKSWFFDESWNWDRNHQDYRMSAEVADIIKGAQSGS